MPSLSKKAISLYIRNGCERQFIFSLYGDPERENYHLPPRQKARPGLGLVGKRGYAWQDEKVSELQEVFGEANVHLKPVQKGKKPGTVDLFEKLPHTQPYQFIIEARYNPDTQVFRSATGFTGLTDYFSNTVSIGENHPDIIQILPPTFVGDLNSMIDEHRNPYRLGVTPEGGTMLLAENDERLRLRVIDIKMASEPGAHYFAEVVFYSITLAAWLEENHLSDKYVVVAAPAVWPGSHEASFLSKQFTAWNLKGYKATAEDICKALERDIEIATFDVFGPRLRRLLVEELPGLLAKPWQELAWHVDFRCKGCEFLGYPWMDKDGNPTNHPSQCLPTAEATENLSRVFGLSRGACQLLITRQVADTTILASTHSDSTVFNDHQGLRAKRTTYPRRAISLLQQQTSIIPNSGGDALMPRWPDLHVYLFIDYDLSTAITSTIGVRAFWLEPQPYNPIVPQDQRHKKSWTEKAGEDDVFLIDTPTLERERAEFLKFLRHLKKILYEVTLQDIEDNQNGRRDSKTEHSTYQIYLWDESQRKHLIRLVGRHLPYILNDPQIRTLAWLFPPPELLQNAEDATRQSPITLVFNVISNTVAAPIPHHYRLMDVVKVYRPASLNAPSIHPLYEEPFSDLLPAERIHGWWERINHWDEIQKDIKTTTQKKVFALNLIISRLEQDLKQVLSAQAAPRVVKPGRSVGELAPHSRLWLEFTRLNAALDSLDVHTIRSLPAHEREARLKSARLTERLSGQEESNGLILLNQMTGKQLTQSASLFVYKLASDSCDVNVKPGDFLYALAPENRFGFLDEHPYRYTRNTSLQNAVYGCSIADAGLTSVSIEAIDRNNGFIALRASQSNYIRQLEKETELDFSANVVLDPIHKDYLTDKVQLTLQGIGNPSCAFTDAKTLQALGLPPGTAPGNSAITPAAEILWQPQAIHDLQNGRVLEPIRNELEEHFSNVKRGMDASQWAAWQESLSRRLTLIWGPPGTGKSHTLRAIVLGAVLDALKSKQTLRLLITANTYTAVDNVILDLEKELKSLLPEKPYDLFRVQSKWHPVQLDLENKYPDLTNLVLNTATPSPEIKALRERLDHPSGILIVGCPPQQLHNLSIAGKKKPNRKPKDTVQSWFDFIIMDEASQMDVASSTLVFTKLTSAGSCVLAGDDLQLPPIQQAEPPKDLENLVGSAYNYFRRQQSIIPASLDVNYRSNNTIVEFTKLAGYSANLTSFSSNLRLRMVAELPNQHPANWPKGLYWSDAWSRLLDPAYPAVCFIYEDRLSSQINEFESDSAAALLWLLKQHLVDKLDNERNPDGTLKPTEPSSTYSPSEFWGKAVGVVTPHRVQMSKVISRLQETFADHSPEDIRNAVDTVERFQGQQRDVIIASFGIGDPDIIGAEDEFLYNLNRFNVLISRARAKVILFITRSLLDYLADDVDILTESRLIKQFAESFCAQVEPIQLGHIVQDTPVTRLGLLRWA